MNYGNKDEFITYHTSRGREIPGTWDDARINSSLLVASEWIDGIYGPYFSGQKTGGYTQEREWPRTSAVTNTWPQYVFGNSDIPTAVINATYEAAWRQASSEGSLEVDYTPGKYKSVSIDGALSVDFVLPSGVSEIQIQIAAVDRLLWPLFCKKYAGQSSLSGSIVR